MGTHGRLISLISRHMLAAGWDRASEPTQQNGVTRTRRTAAAQRRDQTNSSGWEGRSEASWGQMQMFIMPRGSNQELGR